MTGVIRRDEKLALLQRVPLFEHCSKKELASIGSLTAEVDVPAGMVLTTEGEWGREFMVLVDGAAEVRRKGRIVNRLAAGDFFGEIMLVAERTRTATVKATDRCRLLIITASDFHRLMKEVPSIQGKVLDAVARRLPADETGEREQTRAAGPAEHGFPS
jgi:CRP-like cAMP-binding protein